MPDIFDTVAETPKDIFDEVETPKGDIFDTISAEPTAPTLANPAKLRSETYKMLNTADRLSPAVQRNIADPNSGIVGTTLKTGKNVLGRTAEALGYGLGLFTEKLGMGRNPAETRVLNDSVGEMTDLKAARDAAMPDSTERTTLDNFVKYFEGNGVTDGKEMANHVKDSIKENLWDATSNDDTRILSDGTLRINPKFVALPDAQEGLKAIERAHIDPAAKEAENRQFLASRKIAAAKFDEKARSYDADYRSHAKAMSDSGVTDPEKVFYSWKGLDRNWIEKSWDVVRDTVAEGGRGIYRTLEDTAAGATQALGGVENFLTGDRSWTDGEVARMARNSLESSEKSQYVSDTAAARGESGPIAGSVKDLGSSVVQMAPMFAGGGAGRLVAGGLEASAGRKIAGNLIAKTGVFGWAGAQGYGSLMQTAIESARDKAAQEGRDVSDDELVKAVKDHQGAALANGFQTAILTKLLPEGSEATALQGLTARVGQLTGRDVLKAFTEKYGEAGVRGAMLELKPMLKEFAKQTYETAKVGFKDEALEEGVNQFLEGALTKMSGADADKTWDQIGQETWTGAWQGGVIGAALPVAAKTLAATPPEVLEARKVATEIQETSPQTAEALVSLATAEELPVTDTPQKPFTVADIPNINESTTPATVAPPSEENLPPGVPEAGIQPPSGEPAVAEPSPVTPTPTTNEKDERQIANAEGQRRLTPPEASPAQAGEAVVMPRNEPAAPADSQSPAPDGAAKRDATKPGQMTPAEYDEAFRDMAESREKGTPEKATVELRENHIRDIKDSIREELDTAAEADPQIGFMGPQYPLSVEAVDAYGIKLPDGYVKQDDLYVYQPLTPPTNEPNTQGPETISPETAQPAPAEAGASGGDTRGNGIAEKILAELGPPVNPGFPNTVQVGKSIIEITPEGDKLKVSVSTPPEFRGNRSADKAMRKLVDIARRDGVTLDLDVMPTGANQEPGMTPEKLTQWYSGLGFADNGDGTMTLRPTSVEGQIEKAKPLWKRLASLIDKTDPYNTRNETYPELESNPELFSSSSANVAELFEKGAFSNDEKLDFNKAIIVANNLRNFPDTDGTALENERSDVFKLAQQYKGMPLAELTLDAVEDLIARAEMNNYNREVGDVVNSAKREAKALLGVLESLGQPVFTNKAKWLETVETGSTSAPTPDSVPAGKQAKGAPPLPYSVAAIKTAMGVSDEVAVVTDALAQAMGIDTDSVVWTRGGKPGSGALSQGRAQRDVTQPGNSAVTPEMDAAYLDAVEKGDLETAQKMVDEEAKNQRNAIPKPVIPKVLSQGDFERILASLDSDLIEKWIRKLKEKNVLHVDGYHVTDAGKLDLSDKGITPSALDYIGRGEGNLREGSVYLFLDPDDIQNGYEGVLGAKSQVPNVLHIKIPVDRLEDVRWDNNFNISFETYSGARITGGIPYTEIAGVYPYPIGKQGSITYDYKGNIIPLSRRFNQSTPADSGASIPLDPSKRSADDARFAELTADLDPGDIEGWKATHEAEYQELTAMRERVLRAAVLQRFPKLNDSVGAKTDEVDSSADAFHDAVRMIGLDPNLQAATSGSRYFNVKPWSEWNEEDQRLEPWDGDTFNIRISGHERQLSGILNHARPDFDTSTQGNPAKALDLVIEFFRDAESESGKNAKLFDPLATDASGKLIPPSQWGDAGNPSILYQESGAVPTTGGQLLVPPSESGNVLFQPAYHGTPHKVDRFSTEKIGTGEGAQAFGWGLYMAGSESVAKWYADTLGKQNAPTPLSPDQIDARGGVGALTDVEIVDAIQKWGGDLGRKNPDEAYGVGKSWALLYGASEEVAKRAGRVAANFLEVSAKRGNLYRVDMVVEDNEWLDNELAFKDQSDLVKTALSGLGISDTLELESPLSFEDKYSVESFGDNIYRKLVEDTGSPQEASKLLNSLGVKGIRFLDGNSRGRGEGDHNYVIFDESNIRITHENGTPVAPSELQQRGKTPKGSVEFLEDGKALIRGFKAADESTGIHELTHVARRQLFNRSVPESQRQGITDEDIDVVEEFSGAVNGEWTRDAEEKFARANERYLRDGKAPGNNQALAVVFAKMSAWLHKVYATVKGSPIDIEITDAMRAVLDKLYTRGDMTAALAASDPIPLIPDEPSVVVPDAPEGYTPNFTMPETSDAGPSMDGGGEPTVDAKHAFSESERARLGMPERMAKPVNTDQAAWNAALATEEQWLRDRRDGTAGAAFIEQAIREGIRTLSKNQQALVLHEELVRKQKLDTTYADLKKSSTPETQAAAKKAWQEYKDLFDFNDSVGSLAGESLQARKMSVREDYTMASLLRAAFIAKNDGARTPQELTKQEVAQITKQAEELRQKAAQIESLQSENSEQAKLIEALTADVEKAHGAAAVRDIKAKSNLRKVIKPRVDAAKARLQERGITFLEQANDLDAQTLKDFSTVAAEWLIDKTLTPLEFSQKLMATFGTWIAEHSDRIFKGAKQVYNETVSTVSGRSAPKPDEVLATIDGTEDLTKRDVWNLARAYVIAGERGNNVLDAVFTDLSPVFPELTRDALAVLFTDYGKVFYPSGDDVTKELSRVRNLERTGQKLADLKAGRFPKQTGYQRDPEAVDLEVRALDREFRKQFKEAVESGLIDAPDSERALKSALASAKTRMTNEIDELEDAIKRGKARTSNKSTVAFDEEATTLKAQLEDARNRYDAAFPKGEITDAKRAEIVLKSLDRQIAAETKMIEDGIYKRDKRAPIAETTEMAEKRRTLAEKRQLRRDLYEAANPGQTALQQAKNESERAITRLKDILAGKESKIREKKAVNPDEELWASWYVRETLRDEVAEYRRSLPMSAAAEARQIEAALKSAEKSLTRIEAKLASGDLSIPAKNETAASRDAKVQTAREQVKAANRELDARRRDAKIGSYSDDARLQRQLASTQKRIASLEVLKKASVPTTSEPVNNSLGGRIYRHLGLPEKPSRTINVEGLTEAAKAIQKKARPEPVRSAELRRLRHEEAKMKADIHDMLGKLALHGSMGKKLKYAALSIMNAMKVLTLSGDAGMVLRQLGLTFVAASDDAINRTQSIFGNEKAKSDWKRRGSHLAFELQKFTKAFMDPAAETESYDRIMTRDGAEFDRVGRKKLFFSPPHDAFDSQKEDIPRGDLIRNIPWWVWPIVAGVGGYATGLALPVVVTTAALSALRKPFIIALDRAQRVTVNEMRARMADELRMHASLDGTRVLKEKDHSLINNAIMVGSGRGQIRSLDSLVPALNYIALAPRFYFSRIMAMSGQPIFTEGALRDATDYMMGKPLPPDSPHLRTRGEISKMYGKSVAARAAMTMLAMLLLGKKDDEDEEDTGFVYNPFSPDFGRLRVNNYVKIDFMSGINGFMGITARFLGKRRLEANGRYTALGGGFQNNVKDEVGRFLATKQNLLLSFLMNTHAGTYFGGKRVTPWSAVDQVTSAIITNDIVQAFEELGPARGTAFVAFMWGGAGTVVKPSEDELKVLKAERRAANLADEERERQMNEP